MYQVMSWLLSLALPLVCGLETTTETLVRAKTNAQRALADSCWAFLRVCPVILASAATAWACNVPTRLGPVLFPASVTGRLGRSRSGGWLHFLVVGRLLPLLVLRDSTRRR